MRKRLNPGCSASSGTLFGIAFTTTTPKITAVAGTTVHAHCYPWVPPAVKGSFVAASAPRAKFRPPVFQPVRISVHDGQPLFAVS